MTTPTTAALRAIEEALEAGPTPGPWRRDYLHVWSPGESANVASVGRLRFGSTVGYFEPNIGDPDLNQIAVNAAYIAAANPAALSLILADHAALAQDAARWRCARNLLSIEDIEQAAADSFGTFDEAESLKADAAIDAQIAKAKP